MSVDDRSTTGEQTTTDAVTIESPAAMDQESTASSIVVLLELVLPLIAVIIA